MDVIGNNIANINTVGFKASRVTFQEVYNQTLKAASASTSATRAWRYQCPFSRFGRFCCFYRCVSYPGRSSRELIRLRIYPWTRDGFFILSDGAKNYYTRAGNFDEDPTATGSCQRQRYRDGPPGIVTET